MPTSAPVNVPVPPNIDCPAATSRMTAAQYASSYLPRRIFFKPDLAPLIDAKVQEKVREAEEKKLAAGETVNIVSEGTVRNFANLLDDFAAPLLSYVESSVDQAMQFLLRAVVTLVNPLYSLFDLPSPSRHVVQPKRFLPPTDSHGKQHNLRLELDLSIVRVNAAAAGAGAVPSASTSGVTGEQAAHQQQRFLTCLELKTPHASTEDLAEPASAGIFVRLVRFLRLIPASTVRKVKSRYDEQTASLLIKEIEAARVAGMPLFVWSDAYSYIVGVFADHKDGKFDAFISDRHPIASLDPTGPSLLRILLYSLLPDMLGHQDIQNGLKVAVELEEEQQAEVVEVEEEFLQPVQPAVGGLRSETRALLSALNVLHQTVKHIGLIPFLLGVIFACVGIGILSACLAPLAFSLAIGFTCITAFLAIVILIYRVVLLALATTRKIFLRDASLPHSDLPAQHESDESDEAMDGKDQKAE